MYLLACPASGSCVAPLQLCFENLCGVCMQALSTNTQNCDSIAKSGGIRVVIAAIRKNPDNVALLGVGGRDAFHVSFPLGCMSCPLYLLQLLLSLLERISRNDKFKEEITREGGIQVVVDIGIFRHIANEDVVTRCLSTIVNLAFNSPVNISAIMQLRGVKAIEAAMQVCTFRVWACRQVSCARHSPGSPLVSRGTRCHQGCWTTPCARCPI